MRSFRLHANQCVYSLRPRTVSMPSATPASHSGLPSSRFVLWTAPWWLSPTCDLFPASCVTCFPNCRSPATTLALAARRPCASTSCSRTSRTASTTLSDQSRVRKAAGECLGMGDVSGNALEGRFYLLVLFPLEDFLYLFWSDYL